MNHMNMKLIVSLLIITSGLVFLTGCVDDPRKEDVPELITKATLTFTPVGGGTAVVVSATDPDGEGVQDIKPDGAMILNKSTTYILSITLINELADPTAAEYDITAEVEEEGDEHQLFFEWTGSVFSSPILSGNIFDTSNPSKPLSIIKYIDFDENNRPVGLETEWRTELNMTTGRFRLILKHQPEGSKNATSNSETGETDVDLTFDLQIQ